MGLFERAGDGMLQATSREHVSWRLVGAAHYSQSEAK